MGDKRISRGIYKTRYGWRVYVRVDGVLKPKRLPESWEYRKVKEFRDEWRVGIRKQRGLAPAGTETFADDVARYLQLVKHMPTFKERKKHLELWVEVLGATRKRHTIATEEIRSALATWRQRGGPGDTPLAASTVNNRRTALMRLFNALDGRRAPNPVVDVPPDRKPRPAARGLDYRLIEAIFARMPPSRARARLKVMAYTGVRPSELKQVRPSDWDQEQKVLHVRKPTKRSFPRPVPLSRRATTALKELNRVDAWGLFSNSTVHRSFQKAVKKAREAKIVPPGFKATTYDLRHSYGTLMYSITRDLRIVKELLGHSSITMTERYTLGSVPDLLLKATSAFDLATHRPTGARSGSRQPPGAAQTTRSVRRRDTTRRKSASR